MNKRMTSRYQMQQGGAALLIIMLVLIVGAATVYTSVKSNKDPEIENELITRKAMLQAKEALLAYAVSSYERDSRIFNLPCPDASITSPNFGGPEMEGSSDSVCGARNANSLGRLPWRSLNLPALKDGHGECLWYAVSGNFKNNIPSELINEDSFGYLKSYNSSNMLVPAFGQDAQSRVVALIISPGKAFDHQDRSDDMNGHGTPLCNGNYITSEYLESLNGVDNTSVSGASNVVDEFVNFDDDNPYGNDKVLVITRDELIDAVNEREYQTNIIRDVLLEEVANCIASFGMNPNFGNGRLPWPAPMAVLGPQTYSSNDNYNDDNSDDDDDSPNLGRVPYIIDDTIADLGVGGMVDQNTLFELVAGPDDSDCTNLIPVDPPADSPAASILYQHWKDHLFYALSKVRRPDEGPVPLMLAGEDLDNVNKDSITVNGVAYAAVIFFANRPLQSRPDPNQNQNRRALPPIGATEDGIDDRNDITNYLEGNNSANYPDNSGEVDYTNQAISNDFNDILICIDQQLNVVDCNV